MKTKNNFSVRKCLICKKHAIKSEFIRFYIDNSELNIDLEQIKQKRGYYICNDLEEIKKFLKRYQYNTKLNIKINELVLDYINK